MNKVPTFSDKATQVNEIKQDLLNKADIIIRERYLSDFAKLIDSLPYPYVSVNYYKFEIKYKDLSSVYKNHNQHVAICESFKNIVASYGYFFNRFYAMQEEGKYVCIVSSKNHSLRYKSYGNDHITPESV